MHQASWPPRPGIIRTATIRLPPPPLEVELMKWNITEMKLDEIPNEYFNGKDVIIAITDAILIMRQHLNDANILSSRIRLFGKLNKERYTFTIYKMNHDGLKTLTTDDHLVAAAFVWQFLKGMEEPLLYKFSFDFDTIPAPDLPSKIVLAMTVDQYQQAPLGGRHLKLFVYIFKFFKEYLQHTPDRSVDELVHIMVYYICLIPPGETSPSYSARLMIAQKSFKYMLERFNEILALLVDARPDLGLNAIYPS